MDFFNIAAIAGAASASTFLAIAWILRHQNRATPTKIENTDQPDRAVSFLFEDDNLHHATETASRYYEITPGHDDWSDVRASLANRFPDLPGKSSDVVSGETTVTARDAEDTSTLKLMREEAFTRITMCEVDARDPAQSERFKMLQRELDDLRRASDTTNHAIWQVNASGIVTWFNSSYRELYKRLHGADPEPTKPVFALLSGFDETSTRQRMSTGENSTNQHDWYDVHAASAGDITIFHAEDVNAIVKSEIAQRNFVQTLAKTFAQLSIGLAIFDRNGQLALFNPALIDLTTLPADFLSGKPTLMSFFDRIRENRRMPEPKNYHSWRQEISDVIAAATDGRYQETWTLETGQTYRVNGRPHPDGAIAFLIEDISAEVSLTRNFRAELELGQSLMDTFEEALVVYSSTGILTFCNLAYREMWGMDPDNSFADITVSDCVSEWTNLCDPETDWAVLTDFVLDFGEKRSWEMSTSLNSGMPLKCIVSRIASGATVVRFLKLAPMAIIKEKMQANAKLE